MTALDAQRVSASLLTFPTKCPRDAAHCECEKHDSVCLVTELRGALAREAVLLRERDALIEKQATLSRESNHRFLNNLQMVSSLLSIQGRATTNAECASALALAADRVSTIGRVQRHLHSNDGVESVAFKRFVEELCDDVVRMMSAQERTARVIIVEGIKLQLPTTIGIPLGFIVSELITNALKHGDGPITVRLEPDPGKGFALSVANAGSPLPEGFDPSASRGSGMRIIRSFVATIGGELRIGRDDDNRGARFTVLFAPS